MASPKPHPTDPRRTAEPSTLRDVREPLMAAIALDAPATLSLEALLDRIEAAP